MARFLCLKSIFERYFNCYYLRALNLYFFVCIQYRKLKAPQLILQVLDKFCDK
jgi:hypothetical protein